MSANAPVIEVHTSAGTTLPYRLHTAKSGNVYWGITRKSSNGHKFAGKFGVNVTEEVTGKFDDLTSVWVSLDGKRYEFPVKVDTTEKGKLRRTATGPLSIGGADKVFDLRVTVLDPKQGLVNLTGSIRGKSGGNLQVQTEL